MPFEPLLGEIMYFAGAFAPRNWAFCDGQALPVSSNQALFSLLGTSFGGDGVTSFNLPDLRGRAPLGRDTAGVYPLGGSGGVEQVALTLDQIPAHTHTLSVNASSAGGSNASSPSTGAAIGQSAGVDSDSGEFIANLYNSLLESPQPVDAEMVGQAGAGQGHENRQPYAVLSACIALAGIYPSRS